jgi:hypothetical protein
MPQQNLHAEILIPNIIALGGGNWGYHEVLEPEPHERDQ